MKGKVETDLIRAAAAVVRVVVELVPAEGPVVPAVAGADGAVDVPEAILMYWDGTIAEERSATGYCYTRQDAGTSSPAHVTVRPERETRPASMCAALYIRVVIAIILPH